MEQNGNTKKEGLYFMRKKWEIEDEYRKFCRNNKELALQTLRELTLTPTETGKEDQRIAYCMEWMKQQGMESVHTDELGNVIWEYRPEQKKKVLYTAHLDTVFSLEEPLEIKEDGMIWRCPGITDDTVNVVMLLMAAKYVHETEPELPCGLIFAADLGEEGLGNLCGVRALVDHYEENLCGMAAFDLYRDKMYPICIGSVRYRISAKTKGGHSFLNFGRKNAIAELAGLIGELYRFQTDAASHTTYNVGKIEGGTSVNTIAQDASMLFEFRSEDYRSLEACETYLEQTIAARQSEEVQYSCELVGKRPCARETDPVQMARMTRCAQKTLKAADGEEPVCSEASTDCNITLSRHIPAICVGFCRGGGAYQRRMARCRQRRRWHVCSRSTRMSASVDVLREQSRCKGRDRGPKRERGNPAAAGAVRSGFRSAAFPPQQYIPDELGRDRRKDGWNCRISGEYLQSACGVVEGRGSRAGLYDLEGSF